MTVGMVSLRAMVAPVVAVGRRGGESPTSAGGVHPRSGRRASPARRNANLEVFADR